MQIRVVEIIIFPLEQLANAADDDRWSVDKDRQTERKIPSDAFNFAVAVAGDDEDASPHRSLCYCRPQLARLVTEYRHLGLSLSLSLSLSSCGCCCRADAGESREVRCRNPDIDGPPRYYYRWFMTKSSDIWKPRTDQGHPQLSSYMGLLLSFYLTRVFVQRTVEYEGLYKSYF